MRDITKTLHLFSAIISTLETASRTKSAPDHAGRRPSLRENEINLHFCRPSIHASIPSELTLVLYPLLQVYHDMYFHSISKDLVTIEMIILSDGKFVTFFKVV